jgi:hypothetical protein
LLNARLRTLSNRPRVDCLMRFPSAFSSAHEAT